MTDSHTDRKRTLLPALAAIASARTHNDVAALVELFHPEIVYRGNGWKGYQTAPVNGRELLSEMVWSIVINYEVVGLEIRQIVCDGDQVAVNRTVTLRNRGTGRAMEVGICAFLQFRDDKIVEVREHFDTVAMEQLNSQ